MEAGEPLLAEFGIHGEPAPTDLYRLLDMVARRPHMEDRIQQATDELLGLLDISPDLRTGVESRRGMSATSDRVIERMLEAFDATVDGSSDTSSGDASVEIGDLEADLAQQTDPLGREIQAWARLTGEPIESAHSFDDEANATSFARVLARLRQGGAQGSSATRQETAAQVSSVMHAIASDAALRTQVFTLAEDALGTCGDNLDEGFSNIRLAVDNHRMTRAVERGEVNAEQLNHWAGTLFRLSLLETAVQRFIHTQLQRPDLPQRQRDALTDEPLETKVHAKVELREVLRLPSSTASAMRYGHSSVLGDRELLMLELQVKAESEDSQEHDNFLLNHTTWRAGMRALHAQRFQELEVERNDDPFFDLDVPDDVAGQADYAAEALRVKAKWDEKENALLLRLAREGGGQA
jgi:C-terminal novel E3 ligase, LRR-interacting